MVFRTDLASVFSTFWYKIVVCGKQVIPVIGYTSRANKVQANFWQISALSPPIRSWYVCLCVPGGVFR